MRPIFMLGLVLMTTDALRAAPVQFQSATNQTPLLELYTSEGCSSCPPAESWLTKLKTYPGLWKGFVPVAFHVDYWDYLGWRDPFASPSFSERQRAYAAEWRNRSVYTPGFVLDGQEWRGWFNYDGLPKVVSIPVGVLSARSEDRSHWTLRFQPATNSASATVNLHIALLGFGLTSDVKAGENRGRRLEHDFVALDLKHAKATREGDALQATVEVRTKSASTNRLALAVWVTDSESMRPIQSAGSWLPREQ